MFGEMMKHRIRFQIYVALCLVMLTSYSLFAQSSGEVTIGNQIWTSKNLDVSTFRNGEAIPEAKSEKEWVKAGESKQPAWCYYDNDVQNGKKYGKLYNWYAVIDSRGLAPKGYHIPSDAEWTILTDFLGGMDQAADKMKSKTGWQNNGKKSGNGTNSSGFNGFPVGNRYGMGQFFNVGNYCLWWSSTEHDAGNAWYRNLHSNSGVVNRSVNDWEVGLSVRCLRENGDNNFGSNSNHVSNVQIISEKNNNTILQNYSTVTIGTQVWDSKNLDVSTFRNGDPIAEAKSKDEWIAAGKENKAAFCYYNFDMNYGAIYGKLYNYYAVQDSRGLAPKGYHIPTDEEWTVLTDFLGGEDKAGKKMKSKTGWPVKGNGNNRSGFNGLPGGFWDKDGFFNFITIFGYFWSSSEGNPFDAWYRLLYFDNSKVYRDVRYKDEGLSVRCIRD